MSLCLWFCINKAILNPGWLTSSAWINQPRAQPPTSSDDALVFGHFIVLFSTFFRLLYAVCIWTLLQALKSYCRHEYCVTLIITNKWQRVKVGFQFLLQLLDVLKSAWRNFFCLYNALDSSSRGNWETILTAWTVLQQQAKVLGYYSE